MASPKARPGSQIALLAEPDLLPMAQLLLAGPARGVLVTQGFSPEQIASLRAGLVRPPSARRPLHPLLARSTPVHARLVSDYRSKDTTVAEVGIWAESLGLPRRFSTALEQAVDEMLLNALFAAPRTPTGGPRYAGLTAAERLLIQAPPEEQPLVRFAADARRVVVAVRDRFGALRASTVLSYLLRCADSQRARKSPLEHKVSGSGVGLFLTTNAASELLFRLRRGCLTELVFALYRDRPRPLRALLFDDDTPPAPSSERF